MRFKGFQNLFTLGHNVAQKLFELTKLTLDFFQLHQQTCQLFIAALGRFSQVQSADNALRKQCQLRRKLRNIFGAAQAGFSLLRAGPHLVQSGINAGDAIDNLRALRGIVNLQTRHQLRQHIQRRRHLYHLRQWLIELYNSSCRLRRLIQYLQLINIRLHGRISGDELSRALRYLRLGFIDGLDHAINCGLVHIAQLTRRHELAAQLTQLGQCIDIFVNRDPVRSAQIFEQCFMSVRNLVHGLGRSLANALDFFVFVNHRIAGGNNTEQGLIDARQLRGVKPVVTLKQTACCIDQPLITHQRHFRSSNFLTHAVEIRNTTDQFSIANTAQKTVFLRLTRRVIFGGKRCAPDLHGMHA